MAGPNFLKDPDARLEYRIDWADWLAGDRIVTSVWDKAAGDITLDGPTILGLITSIWIQGGRVGNTYAVRNCITTALGRTDDRTLYLTIVQR